MLKALAQYLTARKDEFYRVSAATGATKGDSWIDIDGGIGTLFAYASRGRREFPDETFYVDGRPRRCRKGGTFVGRHICVPLEGVAVHINAFNFPVWGMLEKLAPTFLAGVPAIVKPATVTSLSHRGRRSARWSSRELLPRRRASSSSAAAPATCSTTSTARTPWRSPARRPRGRCSRSAQVILEHSVRFNMEADSLNYSMLGPDAAPGHRRSSISSSRKSRAR